MKDKCEKCGKKAFVSGMRTKKYSFESVIIRVQIWARFCEKCDYEVVNSIVERRLRWALAKKLAKLGVSTPSSLRAMRVALDLTNAELAKLVFISDSSTVSKWQTGAAPLSKSAFALVAQLVLRSKESDREKMLSWMERVGRSTPKRVSTYDLPKIDKPKIKVKAPMVKRKVPPT